MIYPANIEQKLGFDTIRQFIANECISGLGKNLVAGISFKQNYSEINTLLNQTDEFLQILLFDNFFPSQDYYDLTPEIDRIRLQGTFIEIQSLVELRLSLATIFDCIKFLQPVDEETKYPELFNLAAKVNLNEVILDAIDRILDEKGFIKDDASADLRKIRKELRLKTANAEKKLIQTLSIAKKEGWTGEDVTVTIRNGRAVIPVTATNKRKIKGFVHDASATGQTYYIEPEEVFELNNDIRELEHDERLEIVKILTEFTDFLRPYSQELKNAYYFLAQMDFIRAKGKFAIKIEGIKPLFNRNAQLDWYLAKHPLLFLSHQAQKKTIEPLNIKLDNKKRILIISGPNAGGKSVCLKTVGLLQYMLQCGLLVPMKQTSETGIFEKLFIDIGDEQSIENDLSTYSSHLLNMKTLAANASQKTLFLIDEFGTGTEPQLGGAIAEAILEELNNKKAFGVVTTHYSNLKLMADTNEGIVNGAMLYDTTNMHPLYKLKIGKPGSSFAFEIAQNIGLQPEILEKARTKSGKSHLDFEQQLQQLEVDKDEIKRKQQELKVADDFLSEMIDKYTNLNTKLENSKSIIIRQAKEDAKELINQSNRIIENAVRMIKESNAEKEVTQEARENIQHFKEKLENPNQIIKKAKQKTLQTEPKERLPIFIGDYVRIIGQQTLGEVESIKNDKAVLLANSIRVTLPLNQLEKVSKSEAKQKMKSPKTSTYGNIMSNINEKASKFNPSIDVRGKRADEALVLVKQWVDEAILLSVYELSILHGKGNGILRHVIREYLSGIPEVKSYKDEHIERGGDGKTLVSLK
ncbi:MAG: Smr/MutS family protein [Bacteroidetes bacterium]|nr:Smr/MutS family protein [Bacteroidota bacterium]